MRSGTLLALLFATGCPGAVGSGPDGVSGRDGMSGAAGRGFAGAGVPGTGGETATGPFCDLQTSLRRAGECTGLLVGAALAGSRLGESAYANAAREHSYVTAENEMKWNTVERTRNGFDLGPGDQIVSFASQNGMKVKGHTLVWHSQLPAWVSALNNANDVRAAMINHISRVVAHYKGKVVAWDVVNEAWTTPSKTGDGAATLLDSVFHRYLGPGYIDEAFQAARQADPAAKLYYNDYSAEGMNDKSNAVYEMVRDMKMRGVPIDGVGIETHVGTPNDTPAPAEIAKNMQRLAALGLEVVISEMDVNGCDGHGAEEMRGIYHDIVEVCVRQPACTALTFWGVSDRYSWLNSFSESGCGGRSPQPLLWDNNYDKKPAYTGVMEALTGR